MRIWLTQRAEPTPHDDGGKGRAMRTGLMADYFAENGHHVTWWTGDYDHYGKRQRRYGNELKKVSANYDVFYLDAAGYSKTLSLARLKYDSLVARKFSEHAATLNNLPHVIVASMPSLGLAEAAVQFGLKHAIPVIVDIRDLHPDLFEDMFPKILKYPVQIASIGMRRQLERLTKGATAIWANTDDFLHWGLAAAGRQRGPLDKTFPIAYKPVELSKAQLQSANTEWDEKGFFQIDHLNCVFFGTMSQSFDFDHIIQSCKKLSEMRTSHRFYFFGSGAQDKKIKELSEKCQNSIFLGWAKPRELQTAMARSDIGLAPYRQLKNYMVNLPNKPTEYLSGELAIATSLKGSILDTLLSEKNAGFSYETSEQLTDILLALEADPEKLHTMKTSARLLFNERFNYHKLSDAMVCALDETVSSYNR